MQKDRYLFGVKLPQTNKLQLKNDILNLKPGAKATLYFLYSEFLLRANRNPAYKLTLQRGTLTAIDGKGVQWAMWRKMKKGFIPSMFSPLVSINKFISLIAFLILFPIELIWNMITATYTLATSYPFERLIKNEVVLGRDFVYDLLSISQAKGWHVLILGGSATSDDVTRNLIARLYPELKLSLWRKQSTSLLMRDQSQSTFDTEITTDTIFQHFPDLWDARNYVKKVKPDVILTCLGGASGKQEFFVDALGQDEEIDFILATGLGAAVDHLGGGAEQKVAPQWMINSGLEWLHRFFDQPYRRMRIIDSVWTLLWWTTVDEFIRYAGTRKTIVNIIKRSIYGDSLAQSSDSNDLIGKITSHYVEDNEYVLLKQRNWLPSDIGYTFPQGQIEGDEDFIKAGLREIQEETQLDVSKLKLELDTFQTGIEQYSTSFLRFFLMFAQHKECQKWVNSFVYAGTDEGKPNWENESIRWVHEYHVRHTLSTNKKADWDVYQTKLKNS